MHRTRNLISPSWRCGIAGILVFGIALVGCESPRTAAPVSAGKRTEPVDAPAAPELKKSGDKVQPAPKVTDAVTPKKKAPSRPAARPKETKKPAGPPAMPPVLLSEQHRKTCKVFVGETLPPIELPDLSGKKQTLSAALGKKLTLVCFYGGNLPTEEQMLKDLTPEVADRYGKQDVAVVGIAVGGKASDVAAQLKKFGVTFLVLVDADRSAYEKVATDYLPRLFLVDADGKIVWLDLEYSATTRRQISDAIRHGLETK